MRHLRDRALVRPPSGVGHLQSQEGRKLTGSAHHTGNPQRRGQRRFRSTLKNSQVAARSHDSVRIQRRADWHATAP